MKLEISLKLFKTKINKKTIKIATNKLVIYFKTNFKSLDINNLMKNYKANKKSKTKKNKNLNINKYKTLKNSFLKLR